MASLIGGIALTGNVGRPLRNPASFSEPQTWNWHSCYQCGSEINMGSENNTKLDIY